MGTCVIANLCCSKTKIIITSWVWEASESLPSYARHTWDRLKVSSRRWNVSRHKTSNRKARVHYCITPPRVYDVSHKWKRFPLSSRRDWRVIGRQTRLDEAFFFFFLFLPPGWNCNLKSGRCAALRCRASKSWNIKCQNVFLLKYLTASRTTGSCWYKQNNRCCSINRNMKGGKKTVCTLWPTLILFIISQHWELHNWSTTHTQICWFYVYILIIRPTVKEPWLSLSFKSPESRSQILCNHMTPVEEFYLLWWQDIQLASYFYQGQFDPHRVGLRSSPSPRRSCFQPCLLLVGLSATLHKHYWTDFHRTWMEDGPGPEWTPSTFGADPNKKGWIFNIAERFSAPIPECIARLPTWTIAV